MKLSVLMVTNGPAYADPFIRAAALLARDAKAEFVLGCDRCQPESASLADVVVPLESREPMLESVLSQAVNSCSGNMIFRLDDDESCQVDLAEWIIKVGRGHWPIENKNYAFPRLHLWRNDRTALVEQPYWPDWQIRLTPPASAKRTVLHQAAPIDVQVLHPIVHWRFLTRSKADCWDVHCKYARIAGIDEHKARFVYPSDNDQVACL